MKDDESPPPQPRRTRQAKVFDCELAAAQESIRRHRASKAVDEDLYKIPPELLYRKQRVSKRWTNNKTRRTSSSCLFLLRYFLLWSLSLSHSASLSLSITLNERYVVSSFSTMRCCRNISCAVTGAAVTAILLAWR